MGQERRLCLAVIPPEGILSVNDALNHSANISLAGDYTNSTFSLFSDGHGGTFVIDPPVSPSVLDGHVGGQTLTAGAGPTTLIGGPHDILIAGAGTDTFVFGPNFGSNSVVGFTAGKDAIQFDHTAFTDFAAVLAHATEAGSDLVIAADAANMVTLKNIDLAGLQKNDIHIV